MAPPAASSTLRTPRPLTDLQPDSDLLHLLFHRNKNQHRSAKWWKWFGMLRRNLRKLLDPSPDEVGDLAKRIEYMRRVLVPSCYSAFTSVIADTQFAPLGLTLLGVLARVHDIIGPEEEEAPKVKKVKEVEVAVREATTTATDSYSEKGTVTQPLDSEEDFGEAIVRREDLFEDEEIVVEEQKQIVTIEETEDVALQQDKVSENEAPHPPVVPCPSTAQPDRMVAPKHDEKPAKKKKKVAKLAASLLPPSQMPSPLPLPPPREKKAKRKADGKEEAKKKKKRKKADAIDDLFSGLL